jgi:hypothetical protein
MAKKKKPRTLPENGASKLRRNVQSRERSNVKHITGLRFHECILTGNLDGIRLEVGRQKAGNTE